MYKECAPSRCRDGWGTGRVLKDFFHGVGVRDTLGTPAQLPLLNIETI
jgi:hypothetical protein